MTVECMRISKLASHCGPSNARINIGNEFSLHCQPSKQPLVETGLWRTGRRTRNGRPTNTWDSQIHMFCGWKCLGEAAVQTQVWLTHMGFLLNFPRRSSGSWSYISCCYFPALQKGRFRASRFDSSRLDSILRQQTGESMVSRTRGRHHEMQSLKQQPRLLKSGQKVCLNAVVYRPLQPTMRHTKLFVGFPLDWKRR